MISKRVLANRFMAIAWMIFFGAILLSFFDFPIIQQTARWVGWIVFTGGSLGLLLHILGLDGEAVKSVVLSKETVSELDFVVNSVIVASFLHNGFYYLAGLAILNIVLLLLTINKNHCKG